MKKGIEFGVDIINDVSGLNFDKKSFDIIQFKKYSFYFTSYARYTRYHAKKSKI